MHCERTWLYQNMIDLKGMMMNLDSLFALAQYALSAGHDVEMNYQALNFTLNQHGNNGYHIFQLNSERAEMEITTFDKHSKQIHQQIITNSDEGRQYIAQYVR